MRSVLIPKAGPPEVLKVRESADPTPRTGQVLVRVRAAGVNFADVSARLGSIPTSHPSPPILVSRSAPS